MSQAKSDNDLIAISRLSKVLRHEPQLVGIRLDDQGWVSVQELINGIRKAAEHLALRSGCGPFLM